MEYKGGKKEGIGKGKMQISIHHVVCLYVVYVCMSCADYSTSLDSDK